MPCGTASLYCSSLPMMCEPICRDRLLAIPAHEDARSRRTSLVIWPAIWAAPCGSRLLKHDGVRLDTAVVMRRCDVEPALGSRIDDRPDHREGGSDHARARDRVHGAEPCVGLQSRRTVVAQARAGH